MICPYAIIAIASGAISRKIFSASGPRIFSGWCTGIPAANAICFTGGGTISFSRSVSNSSSSSGFFFPGTFRSKLMIAFGSAFGSFSTVSDCT